MDHDSYRNLISGRNTDLASRMLRLALRAVAMPYSLTVRLRNRLYDTKILRSVCASVPVISIGNITAGGTGKTPLVAALCKILHGKNLRCAILTRGYKSRSSPAADEPAILAKLCEPASVITDPDRLRGAAKAVNQYNAQILIMDDGFQHRRLRRDLDIIAIDATCPFGYKKILPAGLLREPLSSLKRAGAFVITRCDLTAPGKLELIKDTLKKLQPAAPVAESIHSITKAVTFSENPIPLEQLKNAPVFAFCGIGNPQAFFDSLTRSGLSLKGTAVFNDHHEYTAGNIEQIRARAKSLKADFVLSTEKDWVKTALLSRKYDDIVFAYVPVVLDFVEGSDKIESLIDNLLG